MATSPAPAPGRRCPARCQPACAGWPAQPHDHPARLVQARAPNIATRAARRAFKDATLNRPGSMQAERRGWGAEGERWALRHFELWRRLCRSPWSPGVLPSQGYGAAGLYKYAAHEGLMMCVSAWDRAQEPPGLLVCYVSGQGGCASPPHLFFF